MRLRGRIFFALCLAAMLAGCASDQPERPRLHAGMPREELKAWYGEPSRIEPAPGGGEDWYYTFSYWSPPQVGGTTSRDEVQQIDTVSLGLSSSHSKVECPVHISPEGRVVGPVPPGKLVPRFKD
jgi:hypothetical protein